MHSIIVDSVDPRCVVDIVHRKAKTERSNPTPSRTRRFMFIPCLSHRFNSTPLANPDSVGTWPAFMNGS